MRFRYARHTSDLPRIEHFYTQIVGLTVLGNFQNHEGYNGVFLGILNMDWHLEFTQSNDLPESRFDEDDALVFYLNSKEEIEEIRKNIEQNIIKLETPKNPYWKENGIQISDPDGHKIIFTLSV